MKLIHQISEGEYLYNGLNRIKWIARDKFDYVLKIKVNTHHFALEIHRAGWYPCPWYKLIVNRLSHWTDADIERINRMGWGES